MNHRMNSNKTLKLMIIKNLYINQLIDTIYNVVYYDCMIQLINSLNQ